MTKPRGESLVPAIGPGIRKAIDFLTRRIDSGVFTPGAPLPGRRDLARMMGLSVGTVSSAVAVLKKAGILQGVRGQKAMVAGDSGGGTGANSLGSATRPVRGFRAVAQLCRADIIHGIFHPGSSLPQIKQLQGRYSTSYRTVTKALALLAGEGVIESRGCGYAVPALASSHQKPIRILFLFYSAKPWLPSREADRLFLRALEQECARNNVELDCGIVSETPNGVMVHFHEDVRAPLARVPRNCSGIVYLVNWAESINAAVFSWLMHSETPVTIIDWLGYRDAGFPVEGRVPVQIIRSKIARQAGYAMGRYVAGLNHREAAFFPSYHDVHAGEYVDGLRASLQMGGSGLRVFGPQQAMTSDRFFSKAEKRWNLFTEAVDLNRLGMPADYTAGSRAFWRSAWDIYEDAEQYAMLVAHFEEALACSEITAWVGCNDSVALMAASFLRSRGKRIPHDIALMGFDNTYTALEQDLTSYDFNFPAMANMALNFLLRPVLSRRVRKLVRPEIEGFIIERGSTARVRNRL